MSDHVRMVHPDLPASQIASGVTRDSFEAVHRHHGWVEVDDAPDVDSLTVAEVLDFVADDPAQAALALDAERNSRNRTTLVASLERIASGTPFDPSDDDNEE